MEHAKLWQWAAMGLQLSLSHGDTALNVRLKWLIVAYDSLASDAISHHLSPSTPWSFSSPADGGGPNGRWYISNNKAVEVSDFLCGRGLISSSEHRNLLPVMLEEDSWQYKARCVAVRGKVPICGYPSTKRKLRNGWFVDDFSTWSKKDLTSYSHHDSTHWGPVWMEQRFADLLFH